MLLRLCASLKALLAGSVFELGHIRFRGAARRSEARKPLESRSRHIPNEVKRQVLDRDSMRCSFISDCGKRCEERGMLEFHHDEPHARGGACTAENIKLMCRAHNGLLAERDFGPLFMAQRVQETRSN